MIIIYGFKIFQRISFINGFFNESKVLKEKKKKKIFNLNFSFNFCYLYSPGLGEERRRMNIYKCKFEEANLFSFFAVFYLKVETF